MGEEPPRTSFEKKRKGKRSKFGSFTPRKQRQKGGEKGRGWPAGSRNYADTQATLGEKWEKKRIKGDDLTFAYCARSPIKKRKRKKEATVRSPLDRGKGGREKTPSPFL